MEWYEIHGLNWHCNLLDEVNFLCNSLLDLLFFSSCENEIWGNTMENGMVDFRGRD